MYSAVHFDSLLGILGDNYFGDTILSCSPTDGTSLHNPVSFSCRSYSALPIFHQSTQKAEKQEVTSIQNHISKSDKLGIWANVHANFLYLPALISHFAKKDSQHYIKLAAAMRCRYATFITGHILKMKINLFSFLWPLTNV